VSVCQAGSITFNYDDGVNAGTLQATTTSVYWFEWVQAATLNLTSTIDSNAYVGVYTLISSDSPTLLPGINIPDPTHQLNSPYFVYDNIYYPDLNPPGHTSYLDTYGLLFEGPGSSQVHLYSLASREYTLALYNPSSGIQYFTQPASLSLAAPVPEPSSCVMAAVGVVSACLANLWKRGVARRHVA
jgi:hypothetical protein